MIYINNQDIILYDRLKENIRQDSEVYILSNYFTINAIFDLLPSLKGCKKVQLLLNEATLDTEKIKFINDIKENESHLNLKSFFRLNKVGHFLNQDKVQVRSAKTGNQAFIIVDNTHFSIAPNDI